MPQDLAQFIEALIKEKFAEVTDEATKAQLQEDLLEQLNERVSALILSELPADKLPEMEKLGEATDEKALQDFIAANIPNLAEKLTQTLSEFRASYVGQAA